MRSKEFDTQQALSAAMNLFWRKGYADSSIEDIIQEMGIHRSSLYSEFKNKKKLFMAAALLYRSKLNELILDPLKNSEEGIKSIADAFNNILSSSLKSGRLGCLVFNVSSEVTTQDDEIRKFVESFQKELQYAFFQALKRAQNLGEIDPSKDLFQLADFLLVSMQGLTHALRSPMKNKQLVHFISHTLQSLVSEKSVKGV